jgi:hypothetical protein
MGATTQCMLEELDADSEPVGECARCGNDISACEATADGLLCGYCQHVMSKDD